jgi:hypothetical protein
LSGYETADNYFFNENEQEPVVTGQGMTNGGVKFPISGIGPIYIWQTPDCQVFTDYNLWLNSIAAP